LIDRATDKTREKTKQREIRKMMTKRHKMDDNKTAENKKQQNDNYLLMTN